MIQGFRNRFKIRENYTPGSHLAKNNPINKTLHRHYNAQNTYKTYKNFAIHAKPKNAVFSAQASVVAPSIVNVSKNS